MNALAKLLEQERLRLETAYLSKNVVDSWRMRFHIMPPVGWLNDPNGLCYFQGRYQAFFQYAPYGVDGSDLKLWGHYSSEDLLHWHYEGAPLLPDSPYDCHGVYSGSAFIEGEEAWLFYTGNVKFDGDYDYINAGRGSATLRVPLLRDLSLGTKEVILKNEDYPDDYSCHIRDPKVWKETDGYHMVLGARSRASHGAVLHYFSDDLAQWNLLQEIRAVDGFGYMWECPDIFPLVDEAGKEWYVLSISPQGLERGLDKFQNVYQSGYFLLEPDVVRVAGQTGADARQVLELDASTFVEWDYGFDFYAPQTFADENERRLLIAWSGVPDSDKEYSNPTCARAWQHCLSLPRVLSLKEGKVYQNPPEELLSLRAQELLFTLDAQANVATAPIQSTVVDSLCFDFVLSAIQENAGYFEIGEDLRFAWDENGCSLTHLSEAGGGRKTRNLSSLSLQSLRVIADASILEFFINEGAAVMSTRFYPAAEHCEIRFQSAADARLWMFGK